MQFSLVTSRSQSKAFLEEGFPHISPAGLYWSNLVWFHKEYKKYKIAKKYELDSAETTNDRFRSLRIAGMESLEQSTATNKLYTKSNRMNRNKTAGKCKYVNNHNE